MSSGLNRGDISPYDVISLNKSGHDCPGFRVLVLSTGVNALIKVDSVLGVESAKRPQECTLLSIVRFERSLLCTPSMCLQK